MSEVSESAFAPGYRLIVLSYQDEEGLELVAICDWFGTHWTLRSLPGRFQGLLPNDLSQRRIHCLRTREYFGDIGLQDHDVRPLRITTRVLSAYRLR